MSSKPWYTQTYRWGQTNLTEKDPVRYDADWWRKYWRETKIQGVIVNANGIVAYYPTKYKKMHQAQYLKERDLFGEIVEDAREEGLVVLARMDSNRVHQRFYMEHPDWTAIDKDGNPYRAGELYLECINSPYYREYLPSVLQEIIELYKPEGITDNSWSGLGRDEICYCQYCSKDFKENTGYDLPKAKDWDSPVYRSWIEWSYSKRVEIWELNNKIVREAGGNDCVWAGMLGGEIVSQSQRFRDIKALTERSEIIMLDMQARRGYSGLQQNGEAGKLLHGLLGWQKLMPESMAMYQAGQPTFRVASKPEPEARMWALEGFAGTIQPWWHHIGAYHEDRRQYETSKPLFNWHEKNEKYLVKREPVATVGIVWNQRNADFYGRDYAKERITLPAQGFSQTLIRSRIPYLPVHIDNIGKDDNLSTLVLPNIGILSEEQCESIRNFVEDGGSIIATGETSLYDKWGDIRDDFALADLFNVHSLKTNHGSFSGEKQSWDDWKLHSYLRLIPEMRARIDGPQLGNEPEITGERHEILQGFEKTDILPFGGNLHVVEADSEARVLFTLVPPFPIYPPETSWMRDANTQLPGLVLSERENGGKVAYLAADIDRCYGRDNLPDHGRLLENIIRWAANDSIPIKVEGAGLIDCHLYKQDNRLIVHLLNLNNSGAWRPPLHEFVPVGPIKISINLPGDVKGDNVSTRVSNQELIGKKSAEKLKFEIESIKDHELIIIE